MEWLNENSIVMAMLCAGFFGLGHWLAGWFTRYRWMRIRRRIACLFGTHTPGRVEDAVGGRRVQRCDWCDRVVREYEVTVNEAKQNIRRIY